jgi:hypothetical protein
MFFASFILIANSLLYSCVHYDNTRIIMPLAKTSPKSILFFPFFSFILRLRKRTYKEKRDDFDDDPRAALALRATLLERVWGFGRCARVLLTRRRAARCELFTRLFVLFFVLLRALNGV